MSIEQQAYEMFYIRGMKYQDIANALGITYDQVKYALQKARKDKEYVREGQDEPVPDYVKHGDTYHIEAHDRIVTITEEDLRKLKDLYCGDAQLTVNQVCREMDIPRRDFHVIKTAFGVTHDDVPFIDEDVVEKDPEELADISLQKRKAAYFTKLEQKEVEHMKKELLKYRKQDYLLQKAADIILPHMKEFAKVYQGPTKPPSVPEGKGVLLEPTIVDLHLGALAWEQETGEDYDSEIAQARFEEVINRVHHKAQNLPVERVLFTMGNDFFHSDTIKGTTTKGTVLDIDSRWHKMYKLGTEMVVRGIDKFRELGPVTVVEIPGNHDTQLSFFLHMLLSAWYKDCDDVQIWSNLQTRKYVEYGKCLIGFAHGDKEGKRIFGNMQAEVPEAWGRTLFREWHLGHLHHESAKEEQGVTIRRLTNMSGTDAYHFEHGFVGTVPRSQTFVWDREEGITDAWYTPIRREQTSQQILTL